MSNFLKNIHPLLNRRKLTDSDTNYAILQALDSVLKDVEQGTLTNKRHSALHSASGRYLNTWGSWFGVYRRDGESDSRYRERIVEYVDMPRGTNQAIKLAIRRYLEDPNVGIEIKEPFRNIFILNQSKLNSDHGMMGNYFRFAVIEIEIGKPFDDDLIDYIYRFTPSGVRVHISYNPSLPRVNDTSSTISAAIFSMTPYASETAAVRYSGLETILGGRIQLRDSDSVLAKFITNSSETNQNDVLTGSFTVDRDLYHVLGTGASIPLKMTSRIGEIYSSLEDLPKDAYLNTTNQTGGTTVTTLKLNPSEETYMVWNIDQYLHNKYYGTGHNISRTRESHGALLENSAFTITSKSNARGHSYDLQAYNFTNRRWVTLSRGVTNGLVQTSSTNLENPTQFLNGNRLMVTRLKAYSRFDLDVDYLALDYRKDVTVYNTPKPIGVPIGEGVIGSTLAIEERLFMV